MYSIIYNRNHHLNIYLFILTAKIFFFYSQTQIKTPTQSNNLFYIFQIYNSKYQTIQHIKIVTFLQNQYTW